MPGCVALRSVFPIATIHAAHQAAPDGTDAFAPVREALAAARGEAVLVARHGWRGGVHRLDAHAFMFVEALLENADLATALERAGDTFDFAAWLQRAIAAGWLKGVARRADREDVPALTSG